MDIFAGNIAAGNQTHAEQIPDPLGVLLVVLVSLNGRNPFGIRYHNVNRVFKDIPNRNPILARALHTNVFTVVFKQLLFESNETAVEGREPFLVIMWHGILAGNDCDDEKGFVNIDAAADGISLPSTEGKTAFLAIGNLLFRGGLCRGERPGRMDTGREAMS